MKANQTESNAGGDKAIPPRENDNTQLLAALDQANDRIRELEKSMSKLREEFEQKQARKRCRPDFSWLAMA